MTHSFANILYLSICMLGNSSCSLFSSADFLQNYVFTNKPPGTTMGVSNTLDTVWHAKSYNRYNILSHIGSFQLGYTCIYTINIRTL